MRIRRVHLDEVLQHCLADTPSEACGVLIGSRVLTGLVVGVHPMLNIAVNPATTYRFNTREQLSLYSRLDQQDLEPIGVYHSHPFGLPELSPTDLAMLGWPSPIQVVVAVERAISAAASGSGDLGFYVQAWRPVAFHRVVPEPIEVLPTQHLTPDVAD